MQQQEQDFRNTHFYQIARPLIERGLGVVPVKPFTKTPATKFKKFRIWTVAGLEEFMQKNPTVSGYPIGDCEVAVVSSRGVGRAMFIDFDDESVIPEIIAYAEQHGYEIPHTLKVLSQIDKPFRQHWIFFQTQYSFNRFRRWNSKNTNVRDADSVVLGPSGWPMYLTRYDVKGVGEVGYVIGAGSRRKKGGAYTIIDNSTICDIPDWLIDWLVKNIGRSRAAWKRVQARKAIAKKRARSLDPEIRAELRRQDHPDGYDIAPEDLRDWVFGRIMAYKRVGISGDALENLLCAQIVEHCQDGAKYVVEHRQGLHNRVFGEPKAADPTVSFYTKRQNKCFEDASLVLVSQPKKTDVINTVVKRFPDRLTVSDAETQIVTAFREAGYTFDKRKDKSVVSDARKKYGFTTTWREWIRHGKPPVNQPTNHNRKRDGHLY